MTLDEVRELRTDIITPAQAAQVLKCDPAYIRIAAREGVLEFPRRAGWATGSKSRARRLSDTWRADNDSNAKAQSPTDGAQSDAG